MTPQRADLPDLTAFTARPQEPVDRLAFMALWLLGAALHLRGVFIGYLDQDLLTLEKVVRAPLADLMRGGVLGGGFTPLSRELYLWWWGKTIGVGALGFHLLSLALAAASAALLYRLGERWAGTRAGWVAAGLWIGFAPLGSMLAWVGGSRELVAAAAYAATLVLFTRGRWLAAGGMTGLAVLTRETIWTLPLALMLADVVRAPGASWSERARRLAPAVVAAVAGIVLLLPRATPVARGFAGAGAPLEFARGWLPVEAFAGFGALVNQTPWLVLVVLGVALFVVPLGAGAARRVHASSPAPAPAALLGVGWMVLGLLPAFFLPGPHRAEVFAVAALGGCLAAGAGLALLPAWAGRVALGAAALISLGTHAVATRSPRLTTYASADAEAARTRPVIDALSPLCRSLSAVPRTFAASVPPDSAFRLALGSGACVACRDPRISVRFLAEFKPEDAASEFGVLRYDAAAASFVHERADARVRARIGEGFLVFARPDAAAACFAAALEAAPENRELSYPLVISLAASGQIAPALARWQASRRGGTFPSAETLAARLVGGFAGAAPDSIESVVVGLAARVLVDPLAAAPHAALGRQLLDMRYARSAAIEFTAASGIGKRGQDVYWLARAYDVLGAKTEALEAYRAALAGGLDSLTYGAARGRFAQLLSEGVPLVVPETPPRR